MLLTYIPVLQAYQMTCKVICMCHPGLACPHDLARTTILQAAEVHFADGRRTVVGRRPCHQLRRKTKHLIEAAPFGRLDQMLRTTIRGVWAGFAPPAKTEFFSQKGKPVASIPDPLLMAVKQL